MSRKPRPGKPTSRKPAGGESTGGEPNLWGAGLSDVWLTPPAIIEALGGWESFDLDPATPPVQPWPTARRRYTQADDGLAQPWEGRVWLNPPYSRPALGLFLQRMAEHGRGVALVFARTDTAAFLQHVWRRSSALLFLTGRLFFHHADGRRARRSAGVPSVLCAYGGDDAEVLAFCGIAGQFVPLRLPRHYLVPALPDLPALPGENDAPARAGAGPASEHEITWQCAVARWMDAQGGPVSLDELFRVFSSHPKAAGNRHLRAKLRQTLNQGGFERLGPGIWQAA